MKYGIVLGCLFLSVIYSDAYAYLDPGTGSYVLQLLLAGLLGAAFALKLFWGRLHAYVKNLFSKRSNDE